jgi:hypothetical protein
MYYSLLKEWFNIALILKNVKNVYILIILSIFLYTSIVCADLKALSSGDWSRVLGEMGAGTTTMRTG